MNREAEPTAALIEGYRTAGEAVRYWGHRFLQSVRRNGGLATAKRILLPRSAGQRKGLDALLDANRPELTLEAIVLRPEFHTLFTADELRAASERFREYGKSIVVRIASREGLFPDELQPGRKYVEGARKQVRVNAYERDARARRACLKHYGHSSVVCEFDFERRYGRLGKGFIHVHHLKPLALTDGEYELDPKADLRPVCPNCHAMLHRGESVPSIEELCERVSAASSPRTS